jgi:hypothetical protein
MLSKINDYNVIRLIGMGGSGLVYLVQSVDKEKYAIKLIPINEKDRNWSGISFG